MQNESFEPRISWGLRMALAGTLPVVWGLATGRAEEAIWITLTAEAVSWVELKGSFAWRVRTLLVASFLAVFFSILGTVTGHNTWLSMLCMFGVGFISTILKNIGDRASNLALSVYLMFIICNAYPAKDYAHVLHRAQLIAIGAAWPLLTGIIISLFRPRQEPFRRQIALIWRSIAALVETVSRSGIAPEKNAAALYQRENEVRAAIDKSYEFYGRMAHQVSKKDNQQYQLTQLRKNAGLVAVSVIAMGDELPAIDAAALDESLRVKAATLFSALKEAITRVATFILTLRQEEKLLATSHISRLKKLVALIYEYPLPAQEKQTIAIRRILQLTERTIKLLESALQRIDQMGSDVPVYRSYSFLKTAFIMRPRYLFNALRALFNAGSITTRYALRSAIAATVALFIYKWYHIDHGYWLPFSVMIIIQPYFGATFKRSIQRVAGTLLGGLAGSLFLSLPAGTHIKEVILFLTFVFMVYYIRKQYGIAAFVITLNLVLLFNIEAEYNNTIMITRALCTIGGALFAITAGFLLFPTWDKKWLPTHLADAVYHNYLYFIATFYTSPRPANWTKFKRSAESRNSNVFDSFNRYMQEPGAEKSEVYYDLVTHNVRITRDLNNVQAEQDEKNNVQAGPPAEVQHNKAAEALALFQGVLNKLSPAATAAGGNILVRPSFSLNETQLIYLEKMLIELNSMAKDLDKLASVNEK